MLLKDWLNKWNVSNLKINFHFLQMEWNPSDADKDAAWEMYIELITRVTTQHLAPKNGDEQTALKSIHDLFSITREIIRRKGRQSGSFAKIAVVILNQKIRPFTAKWHRIEISNGFDNVDNCTQFRIEIAELQNVLRTYSRMLADMADVEDLTDFESV